MCIPQEYNGGLDWLLAVSYSVSPSSLTFLSLQRIHTCMIASIHVRSHTLMHMDTHAHTLRIHPLTFANLFNTSDLSGIHNICPLLIPLSGCPILELMKKPRISSGDRKGSESISLAFEGNHLYHTAKRNK